jgi:DNA-binding NarL/FixJ family response regulator
MRFLVADDQDTSRKMLRRIVTSNPSWLVVYEATNGVEAVAGMERKPDVVIMDVVMPVMDGLEATRQIKHLAPDTVIILTTAYQNHAFRTRGLEAGADGFVPKENLGPDALHKVIADIERKRRYHE